MIVIRPLTVADAATAAELKHSVWPKEVSDPKQITKALLSSSHQAFLALVNGNPAGFVSCFMTTSQAGTARWEIDLLAVHPDFRRQGIASKLVETAVQAGQTAQASISRALIATDNIGSQKSFASQGFKSDGVVHTLFVCDCSNLSGSESGEQQTVGPHLVQVSTFLYDGIWIEGSVSSDAFSAAKNRCLQANLDTVGILTSDTDHKNKNAAAHHSFTLVGKFQWWCRCL